MRLKRGNSMRGIKRIPGLIVILMLILIALPQMAFADEANGGDQGNKSGETVAERTIMLYLCGSDLEGSYGMGTHNLEQILGSSFSANGKVRFIVLTGGSNYWGLDSSYIYGMDPSFEEPEPLTRISKRYNQLWEARGVDSTEKDGDVSLAGKLQLLDGDGITGADGEAVLSKNELMSDPKTLKAFIDLAAEYAPARRYDLILWDHGDGPVGGYGIDSHTKDYDADNYPVSMSFPDMIDAISDNAVIRDKAVGKFDFISFDACLMSNVEIILALGEYTDCFIGSAETEPGLGQEYSGWLNKVGKDPECPAFALGKTIVDDFIAYYDEKDSPGYGQEGTLAVIDMNRLLNSAFVPSLNEMNEIMQSQVAAGNEDGDLLFYDEIGSVEKSISYMGNRDTYRDFGNLNGQICLASKEYTSANVDNIFNEYKAASQKIAGVLKDDLTIYARSTKGIVKDAQMTMDQNGNIQFEDLRTSGMHIFFPILKDTKDTRRYFDLVKELVDSGKIRNSDCGTFLRNYPYTTLYYALLVETGKAVSALIDQGISKQDIDYGKVAEYWNATKVPILDKWGQPSGEETTIWEQTTGQLITRLAGGDGASAEHWLDTVIKQQAGDAVSLNNVSAKKVIGKDKDGCRIRISETDKRIIESVDTQIVAEIPAAVNDIKERHYEHYFEEAGMDYKFCISTIPAVEDVSDLDTNGTESPEEQLKKYLEWYSGNESVWDLRQSEKEMFALRDADGVLHAVSAEFLSGGKALVPFEYLGSKEEEPDNIYVQTGELIFDSEEDGEYVLSQVYPTTGYGSRPILASELKVAMPQAKTIYAVHLPDVILHVAITGTDFTITADNASSIKLVRAKVDDINDIPDADGDGAKDISERHVISDMYHHEYDITDLVSAADAEEAASLYSIDLASIASVPYNGKRQGPKLTYNGKVLTEGVDYKWMPAGDSGSFVNAGSYDILLFGKGQFAGAIQATYSIDKAANPLKIKKGKTAAISGATKGEKGKLKKTRKLDVSKVITFKNKGKGLRTYLKKSGSKKISISRKTGKVTVSKGLKKGTYKVKVKVKAAGNANYKKSTWKTVTFRIKVR